MPIVTVSPSTLVHSCDLAYLRPSTTAEHRRTRISSIVPWQRLKRLVRELGCFHLSRNLQGMCHLPSSSAPEAKDRHAVARNANPNSDAMDPPNGPGATCSPHRETAWRANCRSAIFSGRQMLSTNSQDATSAPLPGHGAPGAGDMIRCRARARVSMVWARPSRDHSPTTRACHHCSGSSPAKPKGELDFKISPPLALLASSSWQLAMGS